MNWIMIPKNYTLGVRNLKDYTLRVRVNQKCVKLQGLKISFDFFSINETTNISQTLK